METTVKRLDDPEGGIIVETFRLLREATRQAQTECELPDFLAARLLAVADAPEQYPDAEPEVRELLDMLPLYDTYAQTGYMGMGVSNLILEGAIARLEKKRQTGKKISR